MGNTFQYHVYPGKEVIPYDNSPLEFDPLYGFPEGARKPKVSNVSWEEIESSQIPSQFQDYCTRRVLDLLGCRAKETPLNYKCNVFEHKLFLCHREQNIDRMKDYERERRLMVRRKRILGRQKQKLEKELEKASELTS